MNNDEYSSDDRVPFEAWSPREADAPVSHVPNDVSDGKGSNTQMYTNKRVLAKRRGRGGTRHRRGAHAQSDL